MSFLPEALPGELVIVCSSLEWGQGVVAKKLFQSSNPWVGFMDRAVLEGELKGPFLEDTREKAGVKSWRPVCWSRVGKEGWWSLRLKYIKYINLTSSSQWWLTSPAQNASVTLASENSPPIFCGGWRGAITPPCRVGGGLEPQLPFKTFDLSSC